jgi:hypothetical protein
MRACPPQGVADVREERDGNGTAGSQEKHHRREHAAVDCSQKAGRLDHASNAFEVDAMRREHVARGLAECVIRRGDGTLDDAEKSYAFGVAFDHLSQT